MNAYLFSNLSDDALEQKSDLTHAAGRANEAISIAAIAEIDARRLYLRSAYPSMFAYCLGRLMLSEDCASKRIQAARVARRFPMIFEMIADGRLHLSGACMLAPYLVEGNARELLTAAARQTRAGIERMLVERFPRTESFDLIMAAQESRQGNAQHAPGHVESAAPRTGSAPANGESAAPRTGSAPANGETTAAPTGSTPGHVETAATRTKIAAAAGQRFTLQVTVSQSTHDKLRHAQALLSHQIPGGELAQVLDLALDALIFKLEQRKVAATTRPHRKRRPSNAARTIPAQVRREVWERDGGQCTFVSASGVRCCARTQLEYDHIDEVARGGEATTDRIRLRCRGHNQYTAEQTFGAEFMARKRAEAREARAEARAAQAREVAEARQAGEARAAEEEDAGLRPGFHG